MQLSLQVATVELRCQIIVTITCQVVITSIVSKPILLLLRRLNLSFQCSNLSVKITQILVLIFYLPSQISKVSFQISQLFLLISQLIITIISHIVFHRIQFPVDFSRLLQILCIFHYLGQHTLELIFLILHIAVRVELMVSVLQQIVSRVEQSLNILIEVLEMLQLDTFLIQLCLEIIGDPTVCIRTTLCKAIIQAFHNFIPSRLQLVHSLFPTLLHHLLVLRDHTFKSS